MGPAPQHIVVSAYLTQVSGWQVTFDLSSAGVQRAVAAIHRDAMLGVAMHMTGVVRFALNCVYEIFDVRLGRLEFEQLWRISLVVYSLGWPGFDKRWSAVQFADGDMSGSDKYGLRPFLAQAGRYPGRSHVTGLGLDHPEIVRWFHLWFAVVHPTVLGRIRN